MPAQPGGFRSKMPTFGYDNNMEGWGPASCERRPRYRDGDGRRVLTKMYRNNADFVYTVMRDFVKSCQTPILVLPVAAAQ